jgi:hypothetical protein
MARKIPYNPMFHPDGRPRCQRCALHDQSREGRETSRLFTLVYELAGYGPTPEHPQGLHDNIPDELNLRDAYYAAYHERGHRSYAELGLEETPPAE